MKFLKSQKKENGNMAQENLWDAAKACFRGIFIVINAYIKKKEVARTT